ncbi:ATP-binding protein [Defluviicoccus vanus]|uniref:ATP-binding protein n=1 Tax=Defluviicoccus vanus TaxID=111831 RepID=A0A7H1N6S2_9PROT|nr:ATP-binding protein [Defluviicoccus vanus]
MARVLETIPSPGRHPIVFGQRGVGKTSLANILASRITDSRVIKVNCDSSDTFGSLWTRILRKIQIQRTTQPAGFTSK